MWAVRLARPCAKRTKTMAKDSETPFFRITGARAELFKNQFALQMVAHEADGGREKAEMLITAHRYILTMELENGKFTYTVKIGDSDEIPESYVDVGRNVVERILGNNVPSIKPTAGHLEYA